MKCNTTIDYTISFSLTWNRPVGFRQVYFTKLFSDLLQTAVRPKTIKWK